MRILFLILIIFLILGCAPQETIQEEKPLLAETCTKGLECSSPSCVQYVDENNNELCDRGE